MVFKLVMAAARQMATIERTKSVAELIAGARLEDGIEVIELKPQSAA